jgi:tRNA(fMet)-specific endonuclease VapC
MRRTLGINICSYILRLHPQGMIERFAALDREQLWLSAIVAAELRFGAAKLGAPLACGGYGAIRAGACSA